MNSFYLDIHQQPEALRRLVAHNTASNSDARHALHRPDRVLLTGMGASYHVALWASYLLQTLDIWAMAVESSDLIHFSSNLLKGVDQVVFISQSGASAEVLPFIEILPPAVECIAITNDPESPLAVSAHRVLTLEAGVETTVASKTYVNSMACMWLLAQEWKYGAAQDTDSQKLLSLSDRMEQRLTDDKVIAATWLEQLSPVKQLFFLGHGPHMPLARQSAMMLGEWAKQPAIGTSIGAFRHGLIEIVDKDAGIVILGSGGVTDSSTALLADELRSYGANVLAVIEGKTVDSAGQDPMKREFDEMLSSLLDVIPAQLFAEALARHLKIKPGFRHISKVIRQL